MTGLNNTEILLLVIGVLIYTLAVLYVGFDAGRRIQMLRGSRPEPRRYKANLVTLGGNGKKGKGKELRYQAILYGPRGVRLVTDAEKNGTSAQNRLEQFCTRLGIEVAWEVANG